jgi:ubiquitin carboxyl-terminal hydrolase L5
MFNLLAVRSAAIPRLTRLIADPQTSAAEKMQMEDQLEHEKNKAKRGDMENSLRRHNLLPTVFALLQAMGQSGSMGTANAPGRVADSRQGHRGCPDQGQGTPGASKEEWGRRVTTSSMYATISCHAHIPSVSLHHASVNLM